MMITQDELKRKVAAHENICKMLNDTYARKNADYGDSFGAGYGEYGMMMPLIRLDDKVRRLKTLVRSHNTPMVKEESIDDTLLDLANYAIMTLIERGSEYPFDKAGNS